jgi:hypothetical protein
MKSIVISHLRFEDTLREMVTILAKLRGTSIQLLPSNSPRLDIYEGSLIMH